MDMLFIAGNFLHDELPHGKDYLGKYFRGSAEKRFLVYYFMFGELYHKKGFKYFYEAFTDHTGHVCSTRWVRQLLRRFNILEKELSNALKKGMDVESMDKVALIRSGKYPIS